ncbi:MAG: hypothetical protein GXY36_02830 [Chloroflexi bacterium]|nr:hypothetical protein [Chloroflexota bacterium]
MHRFLAFGAGAILLALALLVGVPAALGGPPTQLDPTAAQQTIEAAVGWQFAQTAGPLPPADLIETVDAAFYAAQTATAEANGPARVTVPDVPRLAQVGSLAAGGSITAVAYSPHGIDLALGLADGSLHILEMRGRTERLVLQAHSGAVQALAFSPDASLLAAGGADGVITIWDAGSGASLGMFEAGAPVIGLSFSPDGVRLVAAVTDSSTLQIWGLPRVPAATPTPPPSPTGPPGAVAVTPTPDPFPTETTAVIPLVEQNFERGRMFWIEPTRQVWVMQAAPDDPNRGDWFCYPDTFQDGEPELDPALVPPEGQFQPRRGFGKVWRETPGLREGLGWAVTEELQVGSRYTYQPGGTVENGQYFPGPGVHILTAFDGTPIRFFEGEIRGECQGGTWEAGTP